jgi:AraC-like DNA-binding protein
MNFTTFQPDQSISLFVKNIWTFEEQGQDQKTVLPFFADGYPGLMFQETENGLFVSPHNKKMPVLFLYGQTIKPIELVIDGAYKLIVFQLYPFVLKNFFNVNARDINDGCYDLQQLPNGRETIDKLQVNDQWSTRIDTITALLFEKFQSKKDVLDLQVRQAIQLILDNRGQLPVSQICEKINLTKRTFERRFLNEVGISPKQFSTVIQFSQSLEQISVKDYTRLTDVVYNNGFADQSHFIRVFKAFTGKTPKRFNGKQV